MSDQRGSGKSRASFIAHPYHLQALLYAKGGIIAAIVRLQQLQANSRSLAFILFQVVFHALTFIEAHEACGFEGGSMDEYVIAAGFRLNETKTLCRVIPFYYASGHCTCSLEI